MRKRVSAVIMVIFLAFVFVVFAGTLVKYGRSYAYGFFKSYTDQLDEDPDVFEKAAARIYKLDYNTKNRLLLRNELREINVGFQRLLGKQTMSIGTHMMVKLKTGGYYDLFTEKADFEKANELIDFAVSTGAEAGLVYCHSTLYEDGMLPKGTEALDDNNEFADEIIKLFSSAGLTVIDSREAYAASGLTIDEAINKSDVHWSHKMALNTAYLAAQKLGLDSEKLDISKFEDELHADLLIGEYGQRLGTDNVPKDDIHVLYPAYDTDITYEEINNGIKRSGSFEQAVINRANLELNEGEDYSGNAYYIYGHYLAQTHTHNEAAPEKTILIFKDSYGTPLTAFLGLAARDVYAVDLRSTNRSMQEWFDEIKPDMVLFAYSQQMLRNFEYVIAE